MAPDIDNDYHDGFDPIPLSPDWVEYNWQEHDGSGNYIYENELGGETTRNYFKSDVKCVADEALRLKYFADLLFWINSESEAI